MKTINESKGSEPSELFEQTTSHLPIPSAKALKELRALILEVGAENPEIGELSEVLRWGQLSYLTEQTGSGSMIRLGLTKSEKTAMFFHCGTTLIESFRAQYTHLFEFEGNRAMVISEPINNFSTELKHCIRQALTYKLRKS